MKLKLAVLAVAVVSSVAFAKGKEMIVVPVDDVKWFPMDPKAPEGIQLAPVEGDPQKGASSFFLKLPAGSTSPIHAHTPDYHATLISGTHRHYAEGKEADAKDLKPGSFWFQPGKEMHVDACQAGAPCVLFIRMDGKFDFQPKAEKKAPAAATGADKADKK